MVRLLTDAETDAILKLYVGYYGRAPETTGFNFWANEIMGQGSLNVDQSLSLDARVAAISEKFYNDAFEFSANVYYRGMSQEDFIKAAYLNALGRGADANTAEGRAKAPVAEEINYWKGKLDSGDVSYSGLILRFMSEAEKFKETDDFGFMSRLNANRLAVAREFVKPGISGGLSGNAAIIAGEAALANIDATARTGDVLKEYATTQVSTIGGSTLSLTSGADLLGPDSSAAVSLTTSRADSIYAVTNGLLGNSDIIDGGAGNDTIIASWTPIAAPGNTLNPTLSNIENLHVTMGSAAGGAVNGIVDAKDVSGEVRIIGLAAGQDAEVKANLGTKVTAQGGTDTSDLTVVFTDADTGTADAATIGLRGATLDTLTVGRIESLTLDGTSADSIIETLTTVTGAGAAAVSTLKTLTITGDKNVTVTDRIDFAGDAKTGTIDASGSTGKVTLVTGAIPVIAPGANAVAIAAANVAAAAKDAKITATAGSGGLDITTGSKDDTLTGGAGDDEFTSGAGDDTLTGNAGDDKFTIGAGKDTVNGGAGNDTIIVAVGALDKDDTVNGGDGDDTLILAGQTTFDAAVKTAYKAATISNVEHVGTNATSLVTVDFSLIDQTTLVLTGDGITYKDNAGAAVKAAAPAEAITVSEAKSGNGLRLEANVSGQSGNNAVAGTAGVDGANAISVDYASDRRADSFALTLVGATSVIGGAGGDAIDAVGGGGAAKQDGGDGKVGFVGSDIDALSINVVSHDKDEAGQAVIDGGAGGAEDGAGVKGTDGLGLTLAAGATVTLTSTLADAAHEQNNIKLDGFTAAVTLNGTAFAGKIEATGSAGNDTLNGSAQDDILHGGGGNDTINGGAGKDTITGGAGNDTISGGDGDDTSLDGGAGSDVISGGAGDDNITAGAGVDELSGGAGADTFIFVEGDTTGIANGAAALIAAGDFISDYAKGSDIIDWDDTLAVAKNDAAAVAGTAKISAGGVATFVEADDTLAERVTAVEAGIGGAAAAADGNFVIFEHGGNSYVFISDANAGVDAGDALIQLTGVTGIDTSTLSDGNLILS